MKGIFGVLNAFRVEMTSCHLLNSYDRPSVFLDGVLKRKPDFENLKRAFA